MGKYSIAFVPKFKIAELTKLATDYIGKPHTYFLGESSIPHVTICQFYCDENKLDDLCEQIHSEEIAYSLDLSFKKISHLTFNNTVYWISLLPENTEQLHEIFEHISKYVISIRTDEYDPHLTLFNYLYNEKEEATKFIQNMDDKINLEDEFELIIAKCDSVGQLNEIIKTFSDSRKLIFTK